MKSSHFKPSAFQKKYRNLPFPLKTALLWLALAAVSFPGSAQETKNPFKELVSPEKHKANIKYLQRAVYAAKDLAENADYPVSGDRVSKVWKNSNAEKAGILSGSILTHRNDWNSWGGKIPPVLIEEPYTVRLRDKDGIILEKEVEGGRIGATLYGHYRPELAYLRNEIGTRDTKWDNLVLTAFLRYKNRPQYAETSMYYAIQAGYKPDELTDFFQVVFSILTKEGPEEALESFLDNYKGKEIPWAYLPALHNALVVTGRIDFMQQIEEQAGENSVYNDQVIQQFRTWRKGETKWPSKSLLDRAVMNRGKSINSIFKSSNRIRNELIPGPTVGEAFVLDSIPSKIDQIEFTSEDIPHNIHLQITTKVQSNGIRYRFLPAGLNITFATLYPESAFGSEKSRFKVKDLHFPYPYCFLDLQIDTYYSSNYTMIRTSGNGLPGYFEGNSYMVEIPFADGAVLSGTDDQRSIDGMEKAIVSRTKEAEAMEIDLIRYRDEIALFINGICYLHQPTNPNPERNIDLNLLERGANLSIEKLDIWELND